MAARVIIIGAGIGGLAAAIGLRRAGLEVELYERAAAPGEVGAGLTLWANALRALDQIGAADLLGPISAPDLQGGIRAPDGELLAGGYAALGAQLAVVVHRAELHAALLGQIEPGAIHFGQSLSGFEQDGSGVTARFADGGSARAAILIGADGLRSAVRALLHGEARPRYAGYTAWRAVVPFDAARLLAGETWGRGARFGQVPMRDGRAYWFATQGAREGERSPGGERAALLRTFAGWHAPVADLIAAADEAAILRHDIYDRPPLARWGAGRVSLLGDAAHPTTPNLGQGACQAIEDAAVLARCLGQGGDLAAGLRRYEGLRIPRTAAIVRQSRLVGEMGQWHGAAAVRLRTWLLRNVVGRVQARQIDRLLNYQF
jgi:2-polyprenyl-6-methoxyphenol hydroxylase-like FAD-dependent oxidoreductase